MPDDAHWMARALALARAAADAGEAPVGAVLVDATDGVLAEAGNAPIALNDPTKAPRSM
jgi:tRNA(Arg) A34 adenosine deaminase TadA